MANRKNVQNHSSFLFKKKTKSEKFSFVCNVYFFFVWKLHLSFPDRVKVRKSWSDFVLKSDEKNKNNNKTARAKQRNRNRFYVYFVSFKNNNNQEVNRKIREKKRESKTKFLFRSNFDHFMRNIERKMCSWMWMDGWMDKMHLHNKLKMNEHSIKLKREKSWCENVINYTNMFFRFIFNFWCSMNRVYITFYRWDMIEMKFQAK